MRKLLVIFLFAVGLCADEPYNGPRPPKPDLPYLVHGDNLVATEAADATESHGKGEAMYTISGEASSARTPAAEPILLIDAQKVAPEHLELYKLAVRNGNREVAISQHKRGGSRPIHIVVTRVSEHLYRIEADELLENGEYGLSPNDSNRVFCFSVY